MSSFIGTLGNFYTFLKRFYLFIFRERGKEGEREREKHQGVVASHVPPRGDLARNPGATQACALTGNRTGDPLVHRPVLNPLSYASQGKTFTLLTSKFQLGFHQETI